ncbi:MAG: cobalamin-dependent protein [Rhizobiaceae bacterium]
MLTDLLPPDLPSGTETVAQGRALAADWQLESGAFLKHYEFASEAAYKRYAVEQGRIMQHAQIGFRELDKSRRGWVEIHDTCQKHGVRVDRYGICLDWTMGLLRDLRDEKWRGTGLVLEDIEEFVSLTSGAPVAPHFGDFVLGFPAALENTKAALSAGATSIGNLGQYFTFRLPGHDDDLQATEATLLALGLIAGQESEVLVHSNLDDGFAAMFTDLASSLGAMLLEKYIIEELIGARVSHCYGHHFSDPVRRLAFHAALTMATDIPGTMIYGNTTSFRGGTAENFAALATYLSTDIIGQTRLPSGHAINPVPVSENRRIPDIDEIIEAQLFAGRLVELSSGMKGLQELTDVTESAERIYAGGKMFFDNTLRGFSEAGIDVRDPLKMLLALRRLGGRQLENMFGAGSPEPKMPQIRKPIVQSSLVDETIAMASDHLSHVDEVNKSQLVNSGLKIMVATTDVHEHGKLLLDRVFKELGLETIDGGVSIDPAKLAACVAAKRPDAIAISTYNGIALTYIEALKTELLSHNLTTPVLVGGRLNQIPGGSNTSLPVGVENELLEAGALVCAEVEDAIPALIAILEGKQ